MYLVAGAKFKSSTSSRHGSRDPAHMDVKALHLAAWIPASCRDDVHFFEFRASNYLLKLKACLKSLGLHFITAILIYMACIQVTFAQINTKTHGNSSKSTVLPHPVLHKEKENLHTASSAKKSSVLAKKGEKIIVVIDPGHGGKDSGAIGPMGVKEKMVVLAISKIVVQLLNEDPHYRGILTRSTDIYLPLRQRLTVARRYRPDLFVAIHADAAYQNSAIGASVFALSERGATSEMARWLAQKENQSELVDGLFVEKDRVLRSVLLDLSQSHSISVSLEIGKTILKQLGGITHLHYARVEQAAFVVLKSPDIPSLLVETGYLTNPAQERQLNDPAYQKRVALAIVQGVRQHFALAS